MGRRKCYIRMTKSTARMLLPSRPAYLKVGVLGIDLDGLEVALRSSGVVSVGQLPAGGVVMPGLRVIDVVGGETEEPGLQQEGAAIYGIRPLEAAMHKPPWARSSCPPLSRVLTSNTNANVMLFVQGLRAHRFCCQHDQPCVEENDWNSNRDSARFCCLCPPPPPHHPT